MKRWEEEARRCETRVKRLARGETTPHEKALAKCIAEIDRLRETRKKCRLVLDEATRRADTLLAENRGLREEHIAQVEAFNDMERRAREFVRKHEALVAERDTLRRQIENLRKAWPHKSWCEAHLCSECGESLDHKRGCKNKDQAGTWSVLQSQERLKGACNCDRDEEIEEAMIDGK